MPITNRTIALVGQARDDLGARLDATSAVLVDRWVLAWDLLQADFERAVGEVIDDARTAATADGPGASVDPTWPGRGRLLRYRRVQAALEAAEAALETLSRAAFDRTVADATGAAAAASGDSARIMASQMPAAAGTEAALVVRFDKVNADALARIVARTTQQVTALTYPISAEATASITRELIRGVALGRGAGDTARRMVRGCETRFNGGLTRALVIARTETVDAYRAAAATNDAENRDVLAGWTWGAKLDQLTCPSCWAQHGTVHPVDEPGPLDHQQGRCSRIPKTKSWRDLGFDIDEPAGVLPDSEKTFRALPEPDQVAIMGPSRAAGLRNGSITWGSLSTRRETPAWRPSYAPTPVRVLTGTRSP